MAEFISENNQRILWNTIQNVAILHQTIHESQQQEWFRDIIGVFYQRNANRRLNAADLKELNKSAIGYMIQTLKPTPTPLPSPRSVDHIYDTPTPAEPKFKEDISDGVIENMGELLQQQLKQRELDTMNPNNLMEQVASLKLEIKTLSENVKALNLELQDIKQKLSVSVTEAQETA
jgi:hypothetical protein